MRMRMSMIVVDDDDDYDDDDDWWMMMMMMMIISNPLSNPPNWNGCYPILHIEPQEVEEIKTHFQSELKRSDLVGIPSLKFNKHVPSQTESSLPTIMISGAMLNFGAVCFESFFQLPNFTTKLCCCSLWLNSLNAQWSLTVDFPLILTKSDWWKTKFGSIF